MNRPPLQFISHLVTIVSVAIIVFVFILLLAQNRQLSQQIQNQTDINQRYLRCILLIPEDDFNDSAKRVDAIDKCALESRLPSGEAVGEQPTPQESQTFRDDEAATNEAANTEARNRDAQPTSNRTSPPTPQPSASQTAPQSQPATTQPAPPTEPEQPEPGIIDTILAPVREVISI